MVQYLLHLAPVVTYDKTLLSSCREFHELTQIFSIRGIRQIRGDGFDVSLHSNAWRQCGL
jgi:hypothetical protein